MANRLRDQAAKALRNVCIWSAGVEIPKEQAIGILRQAYIDTREAKERGDAIRLRHDH